MTSNQTTTPNTFTVTDSFDGRTIEVLTRVRTAKLARKIAQKIANSHHDQVTLIRIDRRGRRHLVDLFEPQPTKPASAGEATRPVPSTDTEPIARMSRRSALISMCAATVIAVVPGAPTEAREPLIALEAKLKELRAIGEEAWEVCGAAEDHAALMRAEIPWEAIQDRVSVAEREIWNTPAKSPQGVLVKLRETHHQLILTNETEETLESEFAVDLVGDVLCDFERLIEEAA